MNLRSLVVAVVVCMLARSSVRAEQRPVLIADDITGHDAAAIRSTIEQTVRTLDLSPARDPLFDPALPAQTLASYVASKGDAFGLVVRVRPLEQQLAIEIVAVREHAIRHYARVDAGALGSTIADGVRIALDSLTSILTHGVEQSPGPPRVAIVVEVEALRGRAEALLQDVVVKHGSLPLPAAVVAAARVFLPRATDPATNSVNLRQALDADRLVLVLPQGDRIRVHAIDPERTHVRDAASTSAEDVAAALAALPPPTRRAALRSSSRVVSAAPTTALAPGAATQPIDRSEPQPDGLPRNDRGRIDWEAVPATRKATGPYATWFNQSHFAVYGTVAFKEESMYGLGLSDNVRLLLLSNKPGRSTLLSAYASVNFHWKTPAEDAFIGFLPLFHGGLSWGTQTDSWFAHTQAGIGGVATVVKVPGADLVADLSSILVLGTRFGLNVTGWKGISAKPDLVVVYAGFDVVLNSDDNFYVACLGMGI